MSARAQPKADSLLARSGLKRTRPRLAVLELLLERHGPFSTEEVHRALGGRKLDLVTVYRCLASFDKAGLARKCDFGDRITRYELGGDPGHHHHHVVCRLCRKSESIKDCVPPKLVHRVEKMGYSEVSHSLEFFGICPRCRAS